MLQSNVRTSARTLARKLGLSAAVLLAVTALTALLYSLLHVNSATAGLAFLLLVLAVAARVGLAESLVASAACVVVYNYFFLPPIGTLTIQDPQNWVALIAFLAAAITASQLSAAARRKAEEATARELELRRLYDFSRALILGDSERPLSQQAIYCLTQLFGAKSAAIFDAIENRTWDQSLNRDGDHSRADRHWINEQRLADVARHSREWSDTQHQVRAVPIALGGKTYGSIAVSGGDELSNVGLQAIAQLIAIAMERARAQAQALWMEAARQNENLKSVLLDALAHEFKTPLTAMKAATSTLLTRPDVNSVESDLLTVVDEEADRLTQLVTDSIEMGRLASGRIHLQITSFSPSDVVTTAAQELRSLFDGRQLNIHASDDVPAMDGDRGLVGLALRQLLSNAVKYSVPGTPIDVSVAADGGFLVFGVLNDGPAIPEQEQGQIFEKFYRGRDVRGRVSGTGMGLSITREIIEAHGGKVWVQSRPGDRTGFFFMIPRLAAAGKETVA